MKDSFVFVCTVICITYIWCASRLCSFFRWYRYMLNIFFFVVHSCCCAFQHNNYQSSTLCLVYCVMLVFTVISTLVLKSYVLGGAPEGVGVQKNQAEICYCLGVTQIVTSELGFTLILSPRTWFIPRASKMTTLIDSSVVSAFMLSSACFRSLQQ